MTDSSEVEVTLNLNFINVYHDDSWIYMKFEKKVLLKLFPIIYIIYINFLRHYLHLFFIVKK